MIRTLPICAENRFSNLVAPRRFYREITVDSVMLTLNIPYTAVIAIYAPRSAQPIDFAKVQASNS